MADHGGEPVDPALREILASPKSAVEHFLQAMDRADIDDAVRALDLSQLDSATAKSKAEGYAIKLKGILDRMGRIDTSQIVLRDKQNDAFYNLGDDLAADFVCALLHRTGDTPGVSGWRHCQP